MGQLPSFYLDGDVSPGGASPRIRPLPFAPAALQVVFSGCLFRRSRPAKGVENR